MKAIRDIINIDEERCNGCGACIKGCYEGALQLIDGKARIISELYCDGLGACVGDCPACAITIEKREAEPYDEKAVMERIVLKGKSTILAHLNHLKEHGETDYLQQGLDYLEKHGIAIDLSQQASETATPPLACGCPGSMERSFKPSPTTASGFSMAGKQPVKTMVLELTHWPVQLHLLNPQAGYFHDADIVLAADCTAYAYADFHNRFIKNHTLAIACPKLDSNKESYISKITEMMDSAQINTLTVVIMEVPCCGGLIQLASMAADKAARKVPIKKVVVSVRGEIMEESWI